MKRLYRDKSDEMIAGVCSGIANYLDIDPTVIRLLFVLFFFLGGGGLWVYLVLWIIMPEHPDTREKIVEVEEKKPATKKVAAVKAPAAPKPATKKAPVKKTTTKSAAARKTAAKKTPPKTPASKPAAQKKPPEKPKAGSEK